MSNHTFYVCNYADYADLPEVLFEGNTPGKESKSLDGLKFIARGSARLPWMNGDEPQYTHAEILAVIRDPNEGFTE